MEDEDTGQSAKQKSQMIKMIVKVMKKAVIALKMMNSTQHWLQWKLK